MQFNKEETTICFPCVHNEKFHQKVNSFHEKPSGLVAAGGLSSLDRTDEEIKTVQSSSAGCLSAFVSSNVPSKASGPQPRLSKRVDPTGKESSPAQALDCRQGSSNKEAVCPLPPERAEGNICLLRCDLCLG